MGLKDLLEGEAVKMVAMFIAGAVGLGGLTLGVAGLVVTIPAALIIAALIYSMD